MKTYIDCGCFIGDTINIAERYGIKEIYAFDAVPFKEWENYPNVKFEAKAVWIYDGEIDFCDLKTNGSTLISGKDKYTNDKLIKVKCFDFSKWLERFRGYDKVVVKMDIEGAEYEVLKKVIDDKNDDIITDLTIEFHAHKINGTRFYRVHSEMIHEKFKDKMMDMTFKGNQFEKYMKVKNDQL